MGFLGDGNTLSWDALKAHLSYIREHGVLQFLNIWNRNKNRANDPLLWGDELEYILVVVDHKNKTVKLDLTANETLVKLLEEEHELEKQGKTVDVSFRPEYGRFQVEVTPGAPYGETIESLLQVEENMRKRRVLMLQRFKNAIPLTLTHFPLMGVPDCTYPSNFPTRGPDANSMFTPDELINLHRRFGTLTKNIRMRRGSNVAINMPLYMDKHTKPLIYDKDWWANAQGINPDQVDPATIPAKNNHVYADSMAFGMGMCCLQTTFQLPSATEAREVYDQLLPFTPIMLSITCATPILRGYLLDTDARWDIISAAVDDRTPEELGLKPLQQNSHVIDKSRYGSVSSYLAENAPQGLNDAPMVVNEEYRKTLVNAGVDDVMAKHIAHLFIRDPLVVYDKRIILNDETDSDHFENVQSTNWQTLRFKPPPAHMDHIVGWRVEFRPMENNFTDFENAAHAAFIWLLLRSIRLYKLNFYMPISKVDENMNRAHKRDSVLSQRFWFRTNIKTDDPPQVHELTIKEIMHGAPQYSFSGILYIIRQYLSDHVSAEHYPTLNKYVSLIGKRADGSVKTNARWIRDFIGAHPEYKQDSIVTQPILYDLVQAVEKMTSGEHKYPDLGVSNL